MLVRRTEPVPFECVVRGYLSGSAWQEYRSQGTLAGEPLPAGLLESARLEPALFSPATKAESGHDDQRHLRDRRAGAGRRRGATAALAQLRASTPPAATTPRAAASSSPTPSSSSATHPMAAAAHRRGADARFVALLARRPLRARRHPAELRQAAAARLPRGAPAGRQWNGEAPPPPLPAEVIEATSARYLEAYRLLTGQRLEAVRMIRSHPRESRSSSVPSSSWACWLIFAPLVAALLWLPIAIWVVAFFRDPPRDGERGPDLCHRAGRRAGRRRARDRRAGVHRRQGARASASS